MLSALGVALAFLALSSPALASSAPVIESESVSNVTERDATLEAQINPNGAYTGYEFQIDTNASYRLEGPVCPFEFPDSAQCDAIRAGEPLPAGLVEPQPQYIPAGTGDRSVSLDLASIGATHSTGHDLSLSSDRVQRRQSDSSRSRSDVHHANTTVDRKRVDLAPDAN